MFKRKLTALGYPTAETINVNDEKQFRNLILWLEDQKIRFYKIDDRQHLRDIETPEWIMGYQKYKTDLGCPIISNVLIEELQWLLAYAVRLEYSDRADTYNQHAIKNLQISNTPNIITENPLDNLNYNDPELIKGISECARILQISQHPDHLVTLKAINKVISKRLNQQALDNPGMVIVRGTPYPYQDANLGFDLKDPVLNKAAKVLRLLYIQNMRDLQTKINELIVSVQSVTANPKTDTKLGKVGK